MPERYDRALCVTELRIRSDIVSRILTKGWRPESAFQAGPKSTKAKVKFEPDSQGPNSQVADITQVEREIGDLISPSEASSASEEEVDITELYI